MELFALKILYNYHIFGLGYKRIDGCCIITFDRDGHR